ncbi:MAG TPA: glycerol dehydrogenase [Lachnospiraceae bacterium]|nr:glycerol dehydrogenase [Lachnospiraceae bacterium]HEX3076906.1 glycerol dehydrogenase [Lachnospiraceae bacterium]
MLKALIAPSKYIQGKGEINHLAQYVREYGNHALCLVASNMLNRMHDTLESSFSNMNISYTIEPFDSECCMTEIKRIIELCKEKEIDTIVGIGGGKIHDVAKAVSYYSNCPVIIVPTAASTDAPCSALSVLYTEDGVLDHYLHLKHNPNLVLVDSNIIAKAPVRLLVAGMGDALSTFFESRACTRSHAKVLGNATSTLAANAIAKLCLDTLYTHGYHARLAVEQKLCTDAVENIIEANILLSGIGFESGGLACAHSIHNALTLLPSCSHMMHGEKVAFGTFVQLVLEDAPQEELDQLLEFLSQVGLPYTLEALGLNHCTDSDLRLVAERAASEDNMRNMPFEVTEEDIFSALKLANAIGMNYCNRQ